MKKYPVLNKLLKKLAVFSWFSPISWFGRYPLYVRRADEVLICEAASLFLV